MTGPVRSPSNTPRRTTARWWISSRRPQPAENAPSPGLREGPSDPSTAPGQQPVPRLVLPDQVSARGQQPHVPLEGRDRRSQGGGECVEVAQIPGVTGVRDSKDRTGPVLGFTSTDWHTFTTATKGRTLHLLGGVFDSVAPGARGAERPAPPAQPHPTARPEPPRARSRTPRPGPGQPRPPAQGRGVTP
ncbi:DUF397 domain-containing protein [Longispora sp. K20-0274]|uniref:DUF397 domain-containing protein n=1 Tax=Longispora sp. K20-0274 TaxID=3088255 RepID=UPI00399BB126